MNFSGLGREKRHPRAPRLVDEKKRGGSSVVVPSVVEGCFLFKEIPLVCVHLWSGLCV